VPPLAVAHTPTHHQAALGKEIVSCPIPPTSRLPAVIGLASGHAGTFQTAFLLSVERPLLAVREPRGPRRSSALSESSTDAAMH